MGPTPIGALPELVTVTARGALVVRMGVAGNVRDVGEKVATPDMLTPDSGTRATRTGRPVVLEVISSVADIVPVRAG
jgi:hypothetical protein